MLSNWCGANTPHSPSHFASCSKASHRFVKTLEFQIFRKSTLSAISQSTAGWHCWIFESHAHLSFVCRCVCLFRQKWLYTFTRINPHISVCAWVCVSSKRLGESILENLTPCYGYVPLQKSSCWCSITIYQRYICSALKHLWNTKNSCVRLPQNAWLRKL